MHSKQSRNVSKRSSKNERLREDNLNNRRTEIDSGILKQM